MSRQNGDLSRFRTPIRMIFLYTASIHLTAAACFAFASVGHRRWCGPRGPVTSLRRPRSAPLRPFPRGAQFGKAAPSAVAVRWPQPTTSRLDPRGHCALSLDSTVHSHPLRTGEHLIVYQMGRSKRLRRNGFARLRVLS